jgi:leucyl aminopeptidase (aminopeptidase T)
MIDDNMRETLSNVSFDTELQPGAYNAINVCLRLKQEEKIVIITDNLSIEVAASISAEVEKVGSVCHVFVLEDYTARPMVHMPQAVLDELETAQVSIFCAIAQTGELGSRMEMSSVVNRKRIRHGHMVNINKQIMLEGMRANFLEVDALSQRLVEIARKAKTCRVTSDIGTNMIAHFSPDLKWLKTSGIISPDKWGNLPGGEIFTSPDRVDGKFVVDGVVGDYLCEKYGSLENNPLIIHMENSRIVKLECDNKELLEEFNQYTHTDENSDRAGEFAIGTNIAVKEIIGHILQDEKIPGVHIAFGHPYSEHTGAKWVSKTHIDCVSASVDIWLDDQKVLEKGKFIF